MQTSGYTAISRLSGLMSEMRVVANNVANANTTGFRQQGLAFSEFVIPSGQESISMATARVAGTSMRQGTLEKTEGLFDLGIKGDGYFLVGTADGPRLTRAGAFVTGADGILQTMDGNPVLDQGEAPVIVPPGTRDIAISRDGTLSSGGTILGQVGVVVPLEPKKMVREGSQLFAAQDGYEPALDAEVFQGFLEKSNVDVIAQMSRLIEVQRAYEMGQSFLDAEHRRVTAAIDTIFR